MRPILCSGGYGVPIKAGKMRVCQIVAVASDTAAAAQLTLVDDSTITDKRYGNILNTKTSDHQLVFDKKRIAVCDANIEEEFAEPINIIHGLSSLTTDNVEPGSVFVYIK